MIQNVFQDETILAHKTIIAASSNVFHELLDCLKKREEQTSISVDLDNSQPGQLLKQSSVDDDITSSPKALNKKRSSSDVTTANKFIKYELPLCVFSNPDIQYCGTDSENRDVFNVQLPLQIFKIVIDFCYCGSLGFSRNQHNTTYYIDVLTQVIVASQRFGLTNLMKMAAQIINSDSENGTDDLTKQFLAQQAKNLKIFFLNQECWSDIVFKAKDGYVYGHKILLCSGCDVMNAMLAGTFIESKDKEVH